MTGREEIDQGRTVANAFSFACLALRTNVDAINSLNVFPVPDGDTGTNMFLTLKAAIDHLAPELEKTSSFSVPEALSVIARGALLGARGNSGVLLSQFLQGLANGYADSAEQSGAGSSEVDPGALCEGLSRGTDVAYAAVSVPVEGTMLTVMRGASDKAQKTYQAGIGDIVTILEESVRAADTVRQATPDMLDKLREAGVVDAGGQGVVVIMDALREYFSAGYDNAGVDSLVIREVQGVSPLQWHIDTDAEDDYGYCTEFMLRGENIDIELLRAKIESEGDSAIVVGDQALVRIHVHTEDPGRVLSIGAAVGKLSKVKVDDMDQQYTDAQAGDAAPPPNVGVVAVAWGSGIVELFKGMGAGVVTCSETMNPSTQEIIDAVQELGAQNTVVLPNNPNVILTVKQVLSQLGSAVKVIETTTIPAGVSAILNYDSDSDMESNMQTMSTSASHVRSGAITRSVRDIVIDGIECTTGDIIGLLDDRIIVAGKTEYLSLKSILNQADIKEGDLITLYRGADVSRENAEELQRSLEEDFGAAEIELVYGGQPQYAYLVGIE